MTSARFCREIIAPSSMPSESYIAAACSNWVPAVGRSPTRSASMPSPA